MGFGAPDLVKRFCAPHMLFQGGYGNSVLDREIMRGERSCTMVNPVDDVAVMNQDEWLAVQLFIRPFPEIFPERPELFLEQARLVPSSVV